MLMVYDTGTRADRMRHKVVFQYYGMLWYRGEIRWDPWQSQGPRLHEESISQDLAENHSTRWDFTLHFPTVDNHQEENHFLISQKTFPDCNFKLLQMVLVACSELEIIGYYDLKLLQHKCKEIPQDMKQAEMGDVTTRRQFH